MHVCVNSTGCNNEMVYVAKGKLEVVSSVSGILQVCLLLLDYTIAADDIMPKSAGTSYVLMRNLPHM